jgi:DMSO/TMAO reductase YedYZ molybdopterin-dependent catalytic subunit
MMERLWGEEMTTNGVANALVPLCRQRMCAEVMARRMLVDIVRASQDTRASVTRRPAKESPMSDPDPRYQGDEGESSARHRAGSFRRIPLAPHQMQERFTPTPDVFVLCHLGVPLLEVDAWSLTIDGLVARPLCLGFSDLTAYPRCTITSFHQCVGNPLQPFEPTRRIVNIRWSGARLSDILRDCGPAPEAQYLWSYGADYGEFGGMYHQAYIKDLPLERVPSDVVIAYELNGAPLPAEHGFPARLDADDRCRNTGAWALYHALVHRPGPQRRWRALRRDSPGLVGRPRIRHRVAGARASTHAQHTARGVGMGMGRPWNRPGRCQRRRRRDVEGGAGGTLRGASLAAVHALLACHRSWCGRAVLQGLRARRRKAAGVQT